MPSKLIESQKEAEKNLKESVQLRVDIRSLQETIEKQKIQLTKLDNEKTLAVNKSNKEVELLKAKVECLNTTIKEDKARFQSVISQGKEQMRMKDNLINSLQHQLSVIKNCSPKVSEVVNVIKLLTFSCEDCGANYTKKQDLKYHICPFLYCIKCAYEASDKSDFENHIHCEDCKEQFSSLLDLDQHNTFMNH